MSLGQLLRPYLSVLGPTTEQNGSSLCSRSGVSSGQ